MKSLNRDAWSIIHENKTSIKGQEDNAGQREELTEGKAVFRRLRRPPPVAAGCSGASGDIDEDASESAILVCGSFLSTMKRFKFQEFLRAIFLGQIWPNSAIAEIRGAGTTHPMPSASRVEQRKSF